MEEAASVVNEQTQLVKYKGRVHRKEPLGKELRQAYLRKHTQTKTCFPQHRILTILAIPHDALDRLVW